MLGINTMKLYFYTGPQCSLCDLADVELAKTSMYSSLEIEKINIRTDAQLYHLYGARIPVIKRADNQTEMGWPFDSSTLEAFLQ
jgi:hypothetical protein